MAINNTVSEIKWLCVRVFVCVSYSFMYVYLCVYLVAEKWRWEVRREKKGDENGGGVFDLI